MELGKDGGVRGGENTFLFVAIAVVVFHSSRVVVVVMGPVAYLQMMHDSKSAIHSRSSTMKRGDWPEQLV